MNTMSELKAELRRAEAAVLEAEAAEAVKAAKAANRRAWAAVRAWVVMAWGAAGDAEAWEVVMAAEEAAEEAKRRARAAKAAAKAASEAVEEA